jgi:hypothetical protein
MDTPCARINCVVITMGAVIMTIIASGILRIGPIITILFVRTAVAGRVCVLLVQIVPRLALRTIVIGAPPAQLAVRMALLTGMVIEIPIINAFRALISFPTKAQDTLIVTYFAGGV